MTSKTEILEATDGRVMDALYEFIESRKTEAPEGSYTAKMFMRGAKKIAQKLGEEAVETALEAEKGTLEDLADESADLLYHILLLWAARGLQPADVWAELSRRHARKSAGLSKN